MIGRCGLFCGGLALSTRTMVLQVNQTTNGLGESAYSDPLEVSLFDNWGATSSSRLITGHVSDC